MKLLLFAASLRKESSNKKLINLSAKFAKQKGAEVNLVDFSDITGTLYNADIQTHSGFPYEVMTFVNYLKEADGLVVASPEYNFSTPGSLKNLIDWVSRISPMPWKGYPILLMSASPSLVGGNRGLWSTRIPLETCGSFVFPEMFSLASSYNAFDESGNLIEVNSMKRLQQLMDDFVSYVSKLRT